MLIWLNNESFMQMIFMLQMFSDLIFLLMILNSDFLINSKYVISLF